MIMAYLHLWLQLHRVDSNFFDTDFDNALDDVRVSIWRYKNGNGRPWKGIDSPSQNQYRLYYQYASFAPIAWQRLLTVKPTPPPPNEFTANEHKALKAFAGGLEATQEFVPDSWFSPGNKLSPEYDEGDETWKIPKSKKRRSLGGRGLEAVRKGLLTVLRRR